MNQAALDRIWAKVTPASLEECWPFTGALNYAGYGRACTEGGRWRVAHRVTYEHLRGEVPEGLVLDHLCQNPPCVNPWHLEPVTKRVNALRGRLWESEKAHCVHGHPYDEANTYLTPDGHRDCRICIADRNRRHRARRRPRSDDLSRGCPRHPGAI